MNSAPRLLVLGGILFLVLGTPLACYGFSILLPPVDPNTTLPQLTAAIIGLIFGLPLALWGMLTMMQVRRFKAQTAEESKSNDTRPPVVYLRSFKDDQKASMVTPMGGLTAIFPTYVTEEEQIATAINRIGPFLAIGQPGEPILDLRDIQNNASLTDKQKKRAETLRRLRLATQMGPLIFLMPRDKVLPDLGAARAYVGDDEWQDKVKDLLSQAQLVVLRAGETDNLLWEVETVARNVKPEKIIFLLPFSNKKSYYNFRQKVSPIFPKPFPERYRTSLGMIFGSVKGILYFAPDWTPRIVTLGNPFFLFDSFFMPVVPRLHAALQPVYAQVGMQYKENRINLWVVIINIVGCLLALLFLLPQYLQSSAP
jgi:hypothetical protein